MDTYTEAAAARDPELFAQLVEAVRRFTQERLIPNEDRMEAEDEVPEEIVQEMRELGLFGLSVPEAFGGLDLSMVEEAALMMELCQASLAFRSLIGTNVGIGSRGLILDGTDAQKAEWLPRLATGEVIASFALTEPDSGSDAASLRTTARKDGDDYILNGTKRYITNALRAGLFTVMARTDPDNKGAGGISAFLVPADTPGLKLGRNDKKMGQRGTKTSDVIFEDARIPKSCLLGGVEGLGFKTAMKVLDRGRIHISACSVGMAKRLIKEATRFALERKQFGQPIADFQLIRGLLADCETEAYAARAMVEDAARLYDREGRAMKEAACCKYFATEMVGRVADRAVQIHGGAGYMNEYPVERFYRDVRLLRIYEGTSQIQQVVISRELLKEHAA